MTEQRGRNSDNTDISVLFSTVKNKTTNQMTSTNEDRLVPPQLLIRKTKKQPNHKIQMEDLGLNLLKSELEPNSFNSLNHSKKIQNNAKYEPLIRERSPSAKQRQPYRNQKIKTTNSFHLKMEKTRTNANMMNSNIRPQSANILTKLNNLKNNIIDKRLKEKGYYIDLPKNIVQKTAQQMYHRKSRKSKKLRNIQNRIRPFSKKVEPSNKYNKLLDDSHNVNRVMTANKGIIRQFGNNGLVEGNDPSLINITRQNNIIDQNNYFVINMSDTSNAHMTKKEIRSGNSKRLTTNISINHDNKINKDKLYEANNHIRNSRKSEENAYLIHSFQGHHGADGIGIQADLAHADSKDLSSFSSDPNIEYKSAYQRAEVHDSDKSVKDIDSSNIEEVFLPFFDMNHQIIQTNLLNRSNVSTMLRSDVDSSAASPFDHNLTHNNTNKDLQTNYKRILNHDKKSDGFRASNYTTKDNFYSSNYHKNKLMKGAKDNSVPVKTRSFIFTGETYDEINITRKKLLRNRETKHYQNHGTNNKNSEKPIFLVSTNKKG